MELWFKLEEEAEAADTVQRERMCLAWTKPAVPSLALKTQKTKPDTIHVLGHRVMHRQETQADRACLRSRARAGADLPQGYGDSAG